MPISETTNPNEPRHSFSASNLWIEFTFPSEYAVELIIAKFFVFQMPFSNFVLNVFAVLMTASTYARLYVRSALRSIRMFSSFISTEAVTAHRRTSHAYTHLKLTISNKSRAHKQPPSLPIITLLNFFRNRKHFNN